jgi:hypothetical protein
MMPRKKQSNTGGMVVLFLVFILAISSNSSAVANPPPTGTGPSPPAGTGGGGGSTGGSNPQPSVPLAGVIVPLYVDPGPAWNTLIQDKEAYAAVPVVAIINPDSGPGAQADPSYSTAIQQLQAAGITVYGYVYTQYASRNTAAVKADIDAYHSFYGVTNIMLDEVSSQVNTVSYYAALDQYIHTFGGQSIGNPGNPVPPAFIGTLDNFVIYEGVGSPTVGQLSGLGATKATWSYAAYGVPSLNQALEKATAAYVGYVFLTDATLPNPYDILPSYLGTEIAALASP